MEKGWLMIALMSIVLVIIEIFELLAEYDVLIIEGFTELLQIVANVLLLIGVILMYLTYRVPKISESEE